MLTTVSSPSSPLVLPVSHLPPPYPLLLRLHSERDRPPLDKAWPIKLRKD